MGGRANPGGGQLRYLSVADGHHGFCPALRVIEAGQFEILRFNASGTGGERNSPPSAGELFPVALPARYPDPRICPAARPTGIS